ncbi:MAG TPA: hypothetical protein VNZ26_19630 [Vicinamibacterales bacterium]|nr:hypothetical protein [Vicinamibacterales bacterium]
MKLVAFFAGLAAVVFCAGNMSLRAQPFAMPDPKQMSGIPRPVTDLPNGAISVRLIRGQLTNNITNHPVELHVGSKVTTVNTDGDGRAQFTGLTPGADVKAVAVVDGERLESQEFPAPAQGGVRLMLVATDTAKTPATEPDAPAINGQVVIGNESRIVIEPGDESLQLFYLLDIANNARVPVNTATPFAFDLPKEAAGAGIMGGSSPKANVTGNHVTVQGPFPPGHTYVQVASQLPTRGGEFDMAQVFPATFEELAVVVKKVGDATLSSPQISAQRELPAQGEMFIAATGGAVPAGQPVSLSLANLPHRSSAPRIGALSLATLIVGVGVWATTRPDERAVGRAAERKRLIGRRDKLFADLVRLENDRRDGRPAAQAGFDERRYKTRREELVSALERIYSALDDDDENSGPEPAGRPDLAA